MAKIAVVAAVCLVACRVAHAGLGETTERVARDRDAMGADAVLAVSAMPGYERHEITTPDGAHVREFAANGAVFAVQFDGPAMPDLKTTLGDRYDAYYAAARARRGVHNHHVLSFASDGLVVTIVKLPRGFRGEAHVPAMLPAGVRAEDLR